MQMYANICALGAVTSYCFTDMGGKYPPLVAKYLAIAFGVGFLVTEGLALFA
jgi:hypothetical protein